MTDDKGPSNLSVIGEKQGRIHGNSVADGWAGSVTQNMLLIDRPTDQHGKVYSHVSATKNVKRGPR